MGLNLACAELLETFGEPLMVLSNDLQPHLHSGTDSVVCLEKAAIVQD